MRSGISKVFVTLPLILLLLAGFTGCGGASSSGGGGGGGSNGPTAGEYLWEFSLTDNNLLISTVNQSTGQLGAPSMSGGQACNSLGTIPSIAVAPSKTFAFVVDKCFAGIHVYSMNGPGVVLREIPQSPYGAANAVDSIAIDPSGKFLYSSASPGIIYQIAVNGSTGELTPISTAMVNGDIRQVLTDPQGRYVFANDLTGGKVLSYSIGNNGSLSPVAGSPFTVPAGGLPVNLVITSGGNFLYAPLIPSGIAAFAVNGATGALSDIAGSPFATSNQPFSLAIGAGGKYIYSIGGSTNNVIEGFGVDASTGVLTPLAGSLFTMPSSLSSLAVDPSGKFLYVTVNATTLPDSAVLGFAIDSSTGSLTTLPTSPYAAPPFPVDTVSLNIP
ncbi:MAG TPA: beta-propeller fold lactonase family protein [Candidatus Acidoferrum sp.]|jgi:6-phosphogluconolactonase (cycloisomerase 2 family)|nr:beta-propeller fold lactonase family protein [Candidatus Acidoferrum sp.]